MAKKGGILITPLPIPSMIGSFTFTHFPTTPIKELPHGYSINMDTLKVEVIENHIYAIVMAYSTE